MYPQARCNFTKCSRGCEWEGGMCTLFWGIVFAYFIIRYTDINRLASGSFHQVLTIPRDFYATTFLSDHSRLRTSWQPTRKHLSSSDYRATVSDYALAHFTYRNPKPPFSSDRRPWSSRRISYREKARSLSFFFFIFRLLINEMKRDIYFLLNE